jgi:hypothetical protein
MECKRVTQRIKEVEVFLCTQKTDTLLVSATHCAERNATSLPDGRAHAGSAIMKRQDIKHHEIAKYETDHTQATNIGIEDWDGSFAISAPYPHHTIKNEQYNSFMDSLRHRFLFAGDFKAKHQ